MKMMKEIAMRRSIRKYKADPVSDDDIRQLLESACLAPSGSNTQPWHFIVVRDSEIKAQLAAASHQQQWMLAAPVFIVCVADIRSRIKTDQPLFVDENTPDEELKQIIRDTSIAVTHILLAATELALGTCWVAWFTQETIRPILNIPEDKYVVGILPLGYAAEDPSPRPRKNIEDVLHYDLW